MSKRRCLGEEGQANCHDGSGNKHKSLYLVLDDWHRGFTIRKLDADSPDLLTPPVVRLVSPVRKRPMDFAALGSNIIATSNQYAATVVFDTETAALAMGKPLPDSLLHAVNYFLTAGDVLFAFAYYCMSWPHSFEVLTATKDDINTLCPSTDWCWESISTSPFTKDERIESYALHPDGHTIFMSVYISDVSGGTFSFDTKNREWRRHGEWMFPFELQGHFDAELDAFVGQHPDGYICSCQVPSLSSSSSSTLQQPNWKMAKVNKMWSPQHQLAKGRGPTLTYMGNSRFFLVDCVAADGLESRDAFGDSHGCVLNMTTFRLSYDREGNLRIKDRNTTSCPVFKHLSSFSPVAFWM